MDEILASIRRIIESHDEEPQAVATVEKRVVQDKPAPIRAAEMPIDEAEVTAFREALGPETGEIPKPQGAEDGALADVVPDPDPSDASEAATNMIISEEPARKAAAAFDELAALMAQSKARPLAETAEDMLRPMLKDWLDEHLPQIVERLVREEIERIARGGI